VAHAANVGIRRQCYAMESRLRDVYGDDAHKRHGVHVEGAGGEMSLSRFTGVPWAANVGDTTSGDVGPIQVRSRPRHDLGLPINVVSKNKDKDGDPFVLATGALPEFALRGWTTGAAGRRDGDIRDDGFGPYHCLAPSRLRAMDELLDRLVWTRGVWTFRP